MTATANFRQMAQYIGLAICGLMVRTAFGVFGILLTAQHLLSRIRTASSETGMRTSGKGNLLHIGQRVYRITAPSAFTVSLPTSRKKGAGR